MKKITFLKSQVFISVVIAVCAAIIGAIAGTYITVSVTNTEKRQKDNETKEFILKELQESLQQDTTHINKMMNLAKNEVHTIEYLLLSSENNFFNLKNENIDSLMHLASDALSFRPNTSAFEAYKYNGDLTLLNPNTLRSLFELYSVKYKRIQEIVDGENNTVLKMIDPFILDNTKYLGLSNPSYTAKVNREILLDLFKYDRFKHYLNYNRTYKNILIVSYQDALDEIEDIFLKFENDLQK